MSRVGRLPIPLPSDVTAIVEGTSVTVKGPKGEASRSFDPRMDVSIKEGNLIVSSKDGNTGVDAVYGLTRALLSNLVEGVSKGFEKALEVQGVGYRAQKSGERLVLQAGFTHPVEVIPPAGISFQVEGANRIKVTGIDKELVGEIAAKIRAVRPCDSYKGKGIKYLGERTRLKPGKAGRAAAKKK